MDRCKRIEKVKMRVLVIAVQPLLAEDTVQPKICKRRKPGAIGAGNIQRFRSVNLWTYPP
ncbi:hypothetical protein AN476_00345 [Phaeobacter sp. 11ANDIMAR09]|nr:hypothetical protein AN476_00345 [Phaeobacter sp. 11ANDIMAR09]